MFQRLTFFGELTPPDRGITQALGLLGFTCEEAAAEAPDRAPFDRLTALLADVPGLRLAAPGEPADAALVIPGDPEPGPDVALTPRELDVLALIAEGASNKAIARRLTISVRTVKFHIASLLGKLDAQGRAEAVAQGTRLGAIRR